MHNQHTPIVATVKSGCDSAVIYGAGEGAGTPLGTSSKFQAAQSKPPSAGSELRRERWELVARLEPMEAVAMCRKFPTFDRVERGAGPSMVVREDGWHYQGLCRCKSRHGCPMCGWYDAENRLRELEQAATKWHMQGHSMLLMTLTPVGSHTLEERLADLVAVGSRVLARLYGSRRYRDLMTVYGVEHQVRGRECTWGTPSGWHPHNHNGLFVRGLWDVRNDADQAQWLAEEVAIELAVCIVEEGRCADQDRVADVLERSVDVRIGYRSLQEYLEKERRERRWSLLDELARSAVKGGKRAGLRFTPLQLLDGARDPHCPIAPVVLESKWREYYWAMKGKPVMTWSRGARAYFELDQVGDVEVLGAEQIELTSAEWCATRRAGAEDALLRVGEVEGVAGVVRVLGKLVEEHLDRDAVWLGLDGRYRFTEVEVEEDDHGKRKVRRYEPRDPEYQAWSGRYETSRYADGADDVPDDEEAF